MAIPNVVTETVIASAWGNAVADRLNANPKGIRGHVVSTLEHSGIGNAVTPVNGMSFDVATEEGRRYKISAAGRMAQSAVAGNAQIFISFGGGSWRQLYTLAANQNSGFSYFALANGTGTTLTATLSALTSAGTLTIYGSSGYQCFLMVEDVGLSAPA